MDGVIAVGFQPDQAQVLDYPPGAEKDVVSPWRIMQVDHVVVSLAEDGYEFEGDLKTIPPPVRLLPGDPLLDDLNKAGIEAQEVREDVQNFLKLSRDRKGRGHNDKQPCLPNSWPQVSGKSCGTTTKK